MQYNLVVLWSSGVRGLQNVLQMAIYPWSHSRLMNASFADLHWWWFVWRCRISSFKYALIEQNYFWKHCICLDKGSFIFALCKVSWCNCKWRNSRPARQPELWKQQEWAACPGAEFADTSIPTWLFPTQPQPLSSASARGWKQERAEFWVNTGLVFFFP